MTSREAIAVYDAGMASFESPEAFSNKCMLSIKTDCEPFIPLEWQGMDCQ